MSAFGAESVTLALYRYKPSSVMGLLMCLRADSFEEAKRNYFAMALRTLIYTTGNKFPSYADHINDLMSHKKNNISSDERTAMEIANDIRNKLRGTSAGVNDDII